MCGYAVSKESAVDADYDILFVDDDTAIIYGHGDSTRVNDAGEPCHHHYWSSNTLVRRDGRWRPVLSHVSGVSCEPR